MKLLDVQITQTIGAGEFGSVYKGLMNSTTEVALKSTHSSVPQEDFMAEVSVLREQLHRNIVQFYGVTKINDVMYIVMEYCPLGDLLSMIRSKRMDVAQLISIAIGIADGMNYLASNNVVHRDLAARNVLVTQVGLDYTAKVTDFGLSRINDVVVSSSNKFPTRWAAPEILRDEKSTPASDVWSFGVVLYEMFTNGSLPYGELAFLQEVKEYVLSGKTLKSSDLPSYITPLMNHCFAYDPKSRPTFKELFDRLTHIHRQLSSQGQYAN